MDSNRFLMFQKYKTNFNKQLLVSHGLSHLDLSINCVLYHKFHRYEHQLAYFVGPHFLPPHGNQ